MNTKSINAMVFDRLRLGTGLNICNNSIWFDDGVYLWLDTEQIQYKDKMFDMSFKTKKLADRVAKNNSRGETAKNQTESLKENAGLYFPLLTIAGLTVIGVLFVYNIEKQSRKSSQTAEINARIYEYEKNLPNYDDSIRLAKTPEELEYAMKMREQTNQKIRHYSDSLRTVFR